FLSDDAVIEVTCRVGADGATPLPVAPLRPELAGLVAGVSAYEELAVEAALRGGRNRVYTALLAHPLVGQHDTAARLTDELLAANRDHLAWRSWRHGSTPPPTGATRRRTSSSATPTAGCWPGSPARPRPRT